MDLPWRARCGAGEDMSPLVLLLAGTVVLADAASRSDPLPLQRDRFGRVSVSVSIGPHGPYRFLVDTGSSYSSITPDLAARLALPAAGVIRASAVGATGVLNLVRPPDIRLGPRRFAVPWLCVLADGMFGRPSTFDGVIGQDVLRQVNYAIDLARGHLWIDLPGSWLDGLTGERFPLRSARGPLVVADGDAAWSIDSGSSHVVVFRDRGVGRDRRQAALRSTLGTRIAELLTPASIALGRLRLPFDEAVLVPIGRVEQGLLPVWLFDAIAVDNTRRVAILAARGSRQRGDPDVAADLSALEDDAGVARRPGGVADVAVGGGKRRPLLDGAGRRRH
jgi:hypothetical protein